MTILYVFPKKGKRRIKKKRTSHFIHSFLSLSMHTRVYSCRRIYFIDSQWFAIIIVGVINDIIYETCEQHRGERVPLLNACVSVEKV